MRRFNFFVTSVFLFVFLLVGVSCASDDEFFAFHRYCEQLYKYMEQFQKSQKPVYLGYEYLGPDEGDFGLPEEIYSLAYKDGMTTLVCNYYDRGLKKEGAWPFFYTTNPKHAIDDIRVGGSINAAKKSGNFHRDPKMKNHYATLYIDGAMIHVFCNNKGIITAIKIVYGDEPIAQPTLDFINGKVGPNLK